MKFNLPWTVYTKLHSTANTCLRTGNYRRACILYDYCSTFCFFLTWMPTWKLEWELNEKFYLIARKVAYGF